MDYLMRDKVTEYLKLQAQALACLEAIFQENQQGVSDQIAKIQHEQVNLTNRFTRLMYLSGSIAADE